MKTLLLIITLIIAAVTDWGVGGISPYWLPPLPALVFLFWFPYIAFPLRSFLSVALGFLLDSIYPVPFGTYIVTFLTLALAAELLKIFVVHTATLLARLLTFGILFAVSTLLIPSVRFFLEHALDRF